MQKALSQVPFQPPLSCLQPDVPWMYGDGLVPGGLPSPAPMPQGRASCLPRELPRLGPDTALSPSRDEASPLGSCSVVARGRSVVASALPICPDSQPMCLCLGIHPGAARFALPDPKGKMLLKPPLLRCRAGDAARWWRRSCDSPCPLLRPKNLQHNASRAPEHRTVSLMSGWSCFQYNGASQWQKCFSTFQPSLSPFLPFPGGIGAALEGSYVYLYIYKLSFIHI